MVYGVPNSTNVAYLASSQIRVFAERLGPDSDIKPNSYQPIVLPMPQATIQHVFAKSLRSAKHGPLPKADNTSRRLSRKSVGTTPKQVGYI